MTNKEKYGNKIIELAIDERVLALKTVFKFTRKQLAQFSEKFIDYIDTLANYKQFQLTVPMIAQSLADEIKFVCDLEV